MKSKCLPLLVDRIVNNLLKSPERTAYQFVSGDFSTRSISCKELLVNANRIALTAQLAVEYGARAVLIFEPGFDFIQALLGCFLTNTTVIPLAIPKLKTQYLFEHFIDHAQPHCILTHSSLLKRIEQVLPERLKPQIPIIAVDRLTGISKNSLYPSLLKKRKVLRPSKRIVFRDALTPFINNYRQPNSSRPNDYAIIQYTSGTTTRPRGVVINYENLHANLEAIRNHFGLDQNSVCFSWLPHFHDMGLVDGLLTPLYNNCLGIITSPLTVVSNPYLWLQSITQFKVTHTGGPNFIFDLCADKISASEISNLNLRSLSHIYVSAEPVRKSTLKRFSKHFSEAGFTENIFTPGYGLAEATLMVSCKALHKNLSYRKLQPKGNPIYVGLGKPIPGITIIILDPETKKPVNEGVQGEIILSGPTITSGYFNDPEKTADSFIKIVMDGASRNFLRTGDIGMVVDGELFITGRVKNTIIIRGIQYQVEDITYVISNCHQDLIKSGSSTFEVFVENDNKLVVLQEVKRGSWNGTNYTVVSAKIREAIFDFWGLSVYDILLVQQGTLPRTTSGKIMHGDCRNHYLEGIFKKVCKS